MGSSSVVDRASIIGWSLAACCHPYAAWRVLPPAARLVLAAGYFAVGFILALLGLIALSG
jgi:hypothetical protein